MILKPLLTRLQRLERKLNRKMMIPLTITINKFIVIKLTVLICRRRILSRKMRKKCHLSLNLRKKARAWTSDLSNLRKSNMKLICSNCNNFPLIKKSKQNKKRNRQNLKRNSTMLKIIYQSPATHCRNQKR